MTVSQKASESRPGNPAAISLYMFVLSRRPKCNLISPSQRGEQQEVTLRGQQGREGLRRYFSKNKFIQNYLYHPNVFFT